MAFGEEIGDAYIEVHADSRPFRREIRRDAAVAGRESGQEFGDEFGKGVDSELDARMTKTGRRLRKQMTKEGFRSGEGFGDAMGKSIETRLKRFSNNFADAMVGGDWTKVVREFDNLDDAVANVNRRLLSLRKAGRLTSEEFKDGQISIRAWADAIVKGAAKDAMDDLADAATKMNKEFDEAQKHAAKLDFSELRREIRAIGEGAQQMTREFEESHGVALRMNAAMEKNAAQAERIAEIQERDRISGLAAIARQNAANDRAHDNQIKRQQSEATGFRALMEEMAKDRMEFWDDEIKRLTDSEKFWKKWSRNAGKSVRDLSKILKKEIGEDALDNDALQRSLDKFVVNARRSFKKAGDHYDSQFLGRLKGSRNDFLNLIGVIGGMFEKLSGSISTKAFDILGGAVKGLGDRISSLGGSGGIIDTFGNKISQMGEAVTGLGKGGIDGLVVQVIALAVAFQGALMFGGALVSGLWLLTGAAVALASVISSALVGAVASLLPIIAALGVGIGIAVIGFMNMDDAAKDAIKPLQTWFDEVKRIVGANMFARLGDQASELAKALGNANPFIEEMSKRLADFFDSIIAAINDPAFQQTLAILGKTLPGIFTNLLETAKHIGTGITGVMAAIAPTVERVTGKIEDLVKKFSDWANTPEGQNTIATWFEKAATAAESLWDLMVQVGDLISTVFGAGAETGQGFLDSLVDIVTKWNEWLDSPDGQAAMKQWFEDAKKLAGELKDLIEDLGTLFDKLDTPENRAFFFGMVGGVQALVGALGWLAEKLQDVQQWIIRAVMWGQDFIDGFGEGFSIGWNAFLTFWEEKWNALVTWFKDFFGIHSPSTLFAGFGMDILAGLLEGFVAGWVIVSTWWNETVLPFFQGLPEQVGLIFGLMWETLTAPIEAKWAEVIGWWDGTAVPWFEALPESVRQAFVDMWNKFSEPLSGAWKKVTDWWSSTVQPWVAGRPAAVAGFFSTMWARFADPITGAWARVTAWWNGTAYPFIQSLPSRVVGIFVNFWMGLPNAVGQAWGRVTQWWNGTAWPWFTSTFSASRFVSLGSNIIDGMLQGIKSAFGSLKSWLTTSIANIRLNIPTPTIRMPNLPWTATGGVFNGAQHRIIGEAGPEAVVPLNRDLSKVDPSVRALSAFAQGKGNANIGDKGTSIEAGAITVVTPYSNPELVAEAVLDAFAAQAK